MSQVRRALPTGFKNGPLVLGPGDDAALWRPRAGFDIALSCDLLVEGVHFDLATTRAWDLGAKAAAVNLSDLAAMGAQPRLFLVSVAMPRRRGLGAAWLAAFNAGLRAYMGAFGAVVAGGDLSASRQGLFIDVTVLGEVERGKALRRSAARPGDVLFVSGSLGGASAGLEVLTSKALAARVAPLLVHGLQNRHRLPVPKVLAGRWLLQERAVHACIDISDGLASEAWHLSRESRVRLDIDPDAIPIAKGVAEVAKLLRRDPLAFAFNGGEDYELLFTAPRGAEERILTKMEHYTGCKPAAIGVVAAGKGVRIRRPGRFVALADGGYEHFRA